MAVVNEWNPATNVLFTFDASSGAVVLDLSGAGQTASFTMKTGATQGSGTNVFAVAADGTMTISGRTLTAATPGTNTTISAGGATLAGSNLAGGNLILQAGQSTGQGRSLVRIQVPTPATASGTGDNAIVDRIVCGSIATPTGSATAFLTVTLATLQQWGCVVIWTLNATDGTDVQSFTGISTLTAVNKAGALTATITELAGIQSKTVTGASTLTEAITQTNAGTTFTFKMTPTSSLVTTTLRMDYVIIPMSAFATTFS